MITVAILINGHPIVAKNAVNVGEKNPLGQTKYLNDAGEVLWHDRDAGAVSLAIDLLKTIRNDQPHRNPPLVTPETAAQIEHEVLEKSEE